MSLEFHLRTCIKGNTRTLKPIKVNKTCKSKDKKKKNGSKAARTPKTGKKKTN